MSDNRQEVIDAFKTGIFSYIYGFQVKKKSDEESDKEIGIRNIFESESEESSDQEGKGLKILAPNQIPSRLPISLAQLKAENNSEKL